MNKKASFDVIVNLFRLLFVIVVFISVIAITGAFIKYNIDVFETESRLLTARVFFSDDLNYKDEITSRKHIGMIDLQKFLSSDFEKNLMNSIYYGQSNSEASAKITLKDLDDNKVHEKYYNEELYKEKKVLVEAKLIGAGASKRLDTDFYVVIKDNEKLKRGVLNIDAILPNR